MVKLCREKAMNKYIFFLLFAISLFVSFKFDSKPLAPKNVSVFRSPTPEQNLPADVKSVSLDKEVAYSWCPMPSEDHNQCPKNKEKVTVITNAEDRENDKLIYHYTVSGGKIIGRGANVIWDFADTRPGEYTITVAVDDGNGIRGKTLTKTVQLKECPVCDPPCVCPSLAVSGGGRVKAGEAMNFTAHITGGAQVRYKWTVSLGEITSGQGTAEIKVKTTDKMIGKTVEATVEIDVSGLCLSCQTTASESGLVVSGKPKNCHND
jgi:hypothetical protein